MIPDLIAFEKARNGIFKVADDSNFKEILAPANSPNIWRDESDDTYAYCAKLNDLMVCVEVSKYDQSYFSAYLYESVTSTSNNSAVRIPIILASELAGEYAFTNFRDAENEVVKIKILKRAVEIISENMKKDADYFCKLSLINLGYTIGRMHG